MVTDQIRKDRARAYQAAVAAVLGVPVPVPVAGPAGVDRKNRILQSFLYPVSKRRGNEPGKIDLVNDNTGRVISTVSERYELIQNKDVLLPFIEHFGIDRMSALFSHQAGRSFYMSIETGREFDLGGGDVLKERFIVQNSYDKTRSFRFQLGAFRMVCSNGLYTQFAGVNFRKIHVGNIPVSAMIKQGLSGFGQNSFEFWRRLKAVEMSPEAAGELIKAFEPVEVAEHHANRWQWTAGEEFNASVARYAGQLVNKPESVDNQRNAWGVYNQINRAIAAYADRGEISRIMSANARLEEYLGKRLNLN